MWLVHDRGVGKDPLAGEPFKLNAGSPAPAAAAGNTHTHSHQKGIALALAVNIQNINLEILKRHSQFLLESLVLVVTFLNC